MQGCGGSLVARQTSGAEVPGSNSASTTMILMRCRIIVYYCKTSTWGQKNIQKMFLQGTYTVEKHLFTPLQQHYTVQ